MISVLVLAGCGDRTTASGGSHDTVSTPSSATADAKPQATYGSLLPEVSDLPRSDDEGVVVGTAVPDGFATCAFDPFTPREESVAACAAGKVPLPALLATFDAPAGLGVDEVKRDQATIDSLHFQPIFPTFLPADARFYVEPQHLGVSATDTPYGKLFIVETSAMEELRVPDARSTPGVRQLGDASNQGWTYISGKNRVVEIRTSGDTRVNVYVQGSDQDDIVVDEIFKAFTSG